MIPTGSQQRLKASFARQFEPNRDGYLYRRDQKGPAIRVNAQEHADFIADYARTLRWGGWVLVGVTILCGVGLGAVTAASGETPEWWTWAGLGGLMAIFVGWIGWARYAPARALQDRIPVAPALTRDQRSALVLGNLTWIQIGIGIAAIPFMLWNASRAWDIFHGWGRLWLVAGVGLGVVIAVQAVRKWRFERGSRD